MKAVKASKRLIMSIVAFLVSVILCVGAVLAWFVMNDKVDADSASVNVVNGDIVDFTVTVYYLDDATGGYNKADSGNVKDLFGETYNVDYGSDGKLTSDKDSMRPYGGLGNNFATAVLYEIQYEIRVNSNNTYRIYASCPEKSTLSVTPLDDNGDTFSSALSNVVAYYNAEANGDLYSKTSNRASSFVQSTNDKDYVLRLQGGIVPSAANNAAGNFKGTSYFIMDYLPDNFIYLSSEMIKEGGSLNSGLELFGDLTIHIETYDPVTDPDPIPPDPTEPEEPTVIEFDYSAAYSQYGNNGNVTTEEVKIGIFTFTAGVRFEDGRINTQGKNIDVELSGSTNSITFSANRASSSGETEFTLLKDGVAVSGYEKIVVGTGDPVEITFDNLGAGNYTIKTSNAARIYNLIVTTSK